MREIQAALRDFIDGYEKSVGDRSLVSGKDPWQIPPAQLDTLTSELASKTKQAAFRKRYPQGGAALTAYQELIRELEEFRDDQSVAGAINFTIPFMGRGGARTRGEKGWQEFLNAGKEWDYQRYMELFDDDEPDDLHWSAEFIASESDRDYVDTRDRRAWEDDPEYDRDAMTNYMSGGSDSGWFERSAPKRKRHKQRRRR